MWSSTVVAKEAHELRTDGPYAITRHPIYSGMLAMLAGSALLGGLGRWAPALVVGIVVVVVKAHLEERLMDETFPAEYERYRRQVPQLIPGLGWLRAAALIAELVFTRKAAPASGLSALVWPLQGYS